MQQFIIFVWNEFFTIVYKCENNKNKHYLRLKILQFLQYIFNNIINSIIYNNT